MKYFIGGTVFGILLMYGSCVGINHFIASQKDCEFCAIDNYEIRTHTNIPDTKSMDCKYDESTHTKSTIFILNQTPEELSHTIEWNNLKKISKCQLPFFKSTPSWNDSINKLPTNNIYTLEGSNKADSWTIVLDSLNQTYWIELTEDINYKG